VFSVGSIGTLLLFPFLDKWKHAKFMGSEFVTKISLISYSLYLVNLTIVQHIVLNQVEFLQVSPWYKFFIFWLITYLIACAMFKHFEVPAMNLREKFNFSKKL